jgi:hypothetical protein
MIMWFVTPHSDVVGYQCFGGPCFLYLQSEDDILPHHYMVSQPRRLQLESSSPLSWIFVVSTFSSSESEEPGVINRNNGKAQRSDCFHFKTYFLCRVHSPWDAFSQILARGGVRGLWKGSIPNVQRAALVNLGDLTTYDTAKRFILTHTSLTDNHFTHILSR